MRKNECVVIIPAYEPSANFIDYAKNLISSDISALLVVDDGSGSDYDAVFEQLENIEKCIVLRYETNKGKGYALKTAFKYVKEHYDERYSFVTADCDGQHLIEDVLNVSMVASEFGDSFVLGVRDFSQPNVPKRSRMGNVSTRRIFKFLYGVRITDTQTGLRAFPYSLVDDLLSVSGDRFEYEMNQLVVLHKRDVPIREVPISTIYEEKPEDVKTVSHYHTIRDSLRVLKVLLTNLSWYLFASIISAAVELGLHYLGLLYIPKSGWLIFSQAICAQFIARTCSSVVNFIVNYKFVFNGHSKKSIIKYYILWALLFASSLGFAHGFRQLFVSPALSVLMTGLSTLLMSILSYQIQTRWVFCDGKRKNSKFFGLYGGLTRFLYRTFHKKYTSLVARDPLGAVYVCRHLNMHGPLTVLSQIGFDLHPMTFSIFCNHKQCFTHLRDYKYMAVKKMKKFPASVLAFFSTGLVVPLIHSIEAIPVYRKNAQSIVTLKRAIKFLKMHENVILFPDIQYTADQNTETDIYNGFLLMEKMYYKETGRHLRFIPLVIDEENRKIIEKAPVRFKNGDFKNQMPTIKEEIMRSIGCIKKDDLPLAENGDNEPPLKQ